MSQADINSACLNAQGLSCKRGERLLFSGLSLQANAGDCLHVVGANGSGKTSLLRILAGINLADAGDVYWCDQSISGNTKYNQRRAYLGHLEGIKNELSAAENLQHYQRMNGVYSAAAVDQDLARMGILQCADLEAGKMSFGQRRRLSFARLLSGDYALWILDEPFTGIDAQGRALIEEICERHLAARGIIILTNHRSLQQSSLTKHLHEVHLAEPAETEWQS